LYLLDIWPGLGSDQAKTGLLAYRFRTYGEIRWNPNIDYIGPVQTIVVAAMRPVFGTSVRTIRVPVALMAVLAVAVVWGVMRPLLGPRGGLAAAAIAALNPWLIMSSRYALDPMWLTLPNALLLWAMGGYLRHGRARELLLVGALAGLGLTLHPAQIIVLPGLLIVVILGWVLRKVPFRPLRMVACVLVFVILAGPVLPYHIKSLLGRQEVATKKLNIGLQDPAEFFGPAVDILTGRQLYRYFGGPVNPDSAWQSLLGITLVGGLGFGAVTLWRRGAFVGRMLVVYTLIGVAFGYGFCSGMNRLSILGHFRYLICLALLVPMFWAAALVGLTARGTWRVIRLAGAGCLIVALAVLPWQLKWYYFDARTRTGGVFETYRSCECDPKQLAAWYILHNRLPPDRTVILAQDYDLYYPLRYFLEDGYHIQTLHPEEFIPLEDQYPFRALAANPEATWLIVLYPRSRLGYQIEWNLGQAGLLRPEHLVYEVRGPEKIPRGVLALYRIPPSQTRTEWSQRYLHRMDILRVATQGHIPPSGTGKIPRPSPVASHP